MQVGVKFSPLSIWEIQDGGRKTEKIEENSIDKQKYLIL